jgi:hypothetical protein
MTWLILGSALIASGVACYAWLGRSSRSLGTELVVADASGMRSVAIQAPTTYPGGEPDTWEDVTIYYDTEPNPATMTGVFVYLVRDRGFTLMAAEVACAMVYDAIIEQATEALWAELEALGGAA